MSKVEQASCFMEQICNDNSHGYSMQNRWGAPDYDCSSLVISAYEQAGIPVKTRGATYTGNMYSVFKSCGFKDVTSQCNLGCGSGLVRGDVLLNHECHTAIYLGGGKVGHARSSEGNSCPGDQNGQEIRIQSYWNYPWDCVLRYEEEDCAQVAAAPQSPINIFKPLTSANVAIPTVQCGDRNAVVGMLQGNLKARGYNIGRCGVDGEFGGDTERALKNFQRDHNLTQDGICGRSTWQELVKI